MDWDRILHGTAVRAVVAAIVAAISAIWGEWAPPMTALMILMAADFVSGMLRGAEQRQLSSEVALKGTARKFAMIGVMLIVGNQMDVFLQTSFWRDAIVLLYCASETLSILENAVALGLPVPAGLREMLIQLKERKFVDNNNDRDPEVDHGS